MTTAQVAESFDVVFSGGDLLCVGPCPPRADHDGVLPKETPADLQQYSDNRMRILAAMPATVRELQAATGLSERVVQAVLNTLRRNGRLLATKALGSRRVTYALTTESR